MAYTRDAAGTNTGDNATDFTSPHDPDPLDGSADPGDPVDPDPDPPGEVEGVGAIVISEVYGGGGNSGAPFSHDYVELFNRSDRDRHLHRLVGAVHLGGRQQLVGEPRQRHLAPGQYFLVQLAAGANQDLPGLPTPDATGTSNMAAGSGKVALVATRRR
jgi:uncharacterized protein